MADLTSRLERAAKSAMDQLRGAVAAREAIEDGEDPEDLRSPQLDDDDQDDA